MTLQFIELLGGAVLKDGFRELIGHVTKAG